VRVLVIGATGYLGAHVTDELSAAGHAVSAYLRPGSAGVVPDGVASVRGDLLVGDTLPEAVDDSDAVVFCARLLGDRSDRSDERRAIERLVRALRGSGRALVFTSGTGVLSAETDGHWEDRVVAEGDAFEPAALMHTRVGTERVVRESADDGVRGIVVRPPSIWGDTVSSHTTHVLRTATELGAAWYIGPGLNSYSVVHVADLARLFRLAVESGRAGAVYHATAGEVPNRWLAQTVAEVFDVPTRSVTADEASGFWGEYVTRVVMGSSSRTTSEATRRELGWQPTHGDMLADTRELLASLVGDASAVARVLGRRPVPRRT
jgi:nucleoside-diphosphate-sugar epimerase